MAGLFSKVLSVGSNKELKVFEKLADKVNELGPKYSKMKNEEIAGLTPIFKEKLENGEKLDNLLPDAFAAVREMSERTVGMRHFDVQVVGAVALHKGMIAEMKTGEGKTLVSTLAGYLNALVGKGVHIVTVNDYLAKRDSEWMGAIYHAMGMKVGLLQNNMPLPLKKPAYNADVTYGTNSEFGFDYLRDNMVTSASQRVQRGHHYAIVDEVDSILIDEARTPLIISGAGTKSANTYRDFAKAVRGLKEDEDFEMDEAKHTIMTTDQGLSKIERALGGVNIYGDMAGRLVNHLQQALKAEYMFHRDQQYVVVGGEVKIVDEFTGRIMEGRRYSEGLHQAIEAKEGVVVKEENQTLATITLQNYFRLYDKISGMTGTAMTEDAEFREIYKLPVQEIPSNKPVIRKDLDDQIYVDVENKFNAVANDIEKRHENGQPVLVGTVTIEHSEHLSHILDERGIKHEVLNAKFHEREAQIVAQAGREGAVTIATNMAGRGTDILLGGNPEVLAEDMLTEQDIDVETATKAQRDKALKAARKICEKEREHVLEAGGLCVIGTERHESRRIDNQLRGRSGRQGDPGETRFYLSLEDDLMRLFGADKMDRIGRMMKRADMPGDMPLEARMVSKAVEGAQRKIEQINFGMRKSVLDYDDVMNEQRKSFYAERNRVLDGKDLTEHMQEMLTKTVMNAVNDYCPEGTKPKEWDLDALKKWVYEMTGHRACPDLKKIVEKDDKSSSKKDKVASEEKKDEKEVKTDNKSDKGEDKHEKRKKEHAKHGVAGVREEIAVALEEHLDKLYEERAQKLTPELMSGLTQQVMLRVMDTRWMTYLQEMEYLKTGIGLRGFGQRDPLVEYKQEAHVAFMSLTAAIYEDLIRTILRIELAQAPAPSANDENEELAGATYSGAEELDGDNGRKRAVPAQPRGRIAATSNVARRGMDESKPRPYVKAESDPFAGVGRNDPCPCGSGKKFKNCHGKNR